MGTLQMYVARNWQERMAAGRSGVPMIFVHTPKCGGSYVGHVLHRYRKRCVTLNTPELAGHLTWRQYRDRMALIGLDISDYTTFSVVRNPFEWHVSWFFYIRQPKGGRRSGYHVEHRLFQKMQFCDYVDWLDDPEALQGPRHEMGQEICEWVIGDRGEIVVDTILRQERLKADLAEMRDRYGLMINPVEKQVNTSPRKDYRKLYSAKAVDVIARRHARDLEMFGYTFE